MIIGVPTEIKNNENRTALTPGGVKNLTTNGHKVLIQTGAGEGSGFENEEYVKNGAELIDEPEEVWSQADMILKVKEPLESEYKYLRKGLILLTYLHLASNPTLTKALVENEVTGIGYETVEVNGKLPLLTPMSEVAGRMAVQLGARYLEKREGGKGILLSGVPGVERGTITIIGGGVVGENAARMAIGMRANVNILELNPDRMRELMHMFGPGEIQTLASNPENIANAVKESDLVIGSVLIPGRKAPKLVTEEMIKSMEKGSVVVDIAIDQGGNFETIDGPTTHDNPIIEKHGILHYAVANIPGAVPKTATLALTNDSTPYIVNIANNGLEEELKTNEPLVKGVNTFKGKVTNKGLAEDLGYEYASVKELLQ